MTQTSLLEPFCVPEFLVDVSSESSDESNDDKATSEGTTSNSTSLNDPVVANNNYEDT